MASEKLKEYKKITEELATLYVAKNEEYGDSFGEMFKEDGLAPCLYQLKHKINRAISVSSKDDIEFESLEDTLKDLANYAIMSYMEYRLSKPSDEEYELKPSFGIQKTIEGFVYGKEQEKEVEENDEDSFDKLKRMVIDDINEIIRKIENIEDKIKIANMFYPLEKTTNFGEFFNEFVNIIDSWEESGGLENLSESEIKFLWAMKRNLNFYRKSWR